MKRKFTVSIVTALLAIIISAYSGLQNPVTSSPTPDPHPAETPPPDSAPQSSSETQIFSDKATSLTLLCGSETLTVNMEDFLIGAVAAEMPAGFEPDALKAQAVALRTYVLYKMQNPSSAHEEDICSDSSCCAAWKSEDALREKWGDNYDAYILKIHTAISDTDGYYLTYSDEPILAAFHSSSAGKTENADDVWQRPLPYLVSVQSPETADDVPNYNTTVTMLTSEFKNTVLNQFPSADFSAAPDKWIGSALYDAGGRLKSVIIGGAEVKGTELRSMFSLRSAAIDISYSETEDAVIMSVTGYGHGVGMSQYGANVMAENGSDWKDILAWYYPGTSLQNEKGTGQN